MILGLFLLLWQASTPSPGCTVKSLGLSTRSMSKDLAESTAKAYFAPTPVFTRQTSTTGQRFDLVEIGIMDARFGFGKPVQITKGFDTTSQWRKAWNMILINECKAKHEREPVKF